ncbi:MAG: hypothetical protein JWM82_733, partial [Myxococcales bacterium]|nr:hypothetical protein [Myxococcales bacterium]
MRKVRLKNLTNARPRGPTSGVVFRVRTAGVWLFVLAGLVAPRPARAEKVHRGGAFVLGSKEHVEMKTTIEALL